MSDSNKSTKAIDKSPAESEAKKQAGQRLGAARIEAQAYYERGLRAFGSDNYEDALADLDAAVQRAPGYAELYSARGWIGLEAGKKPGAEEDFRYALQLSKRQWLAHYGLGVLAFQSRKWDEAIDHFSHAVAVAPGRPEPWYYRAVSYYNSGELEKARTDMRTALRWLSDETDDRRADTIKWLKALGDNSTDEAEAKPAAKAAKLPAAKETKEIAKSAGEAKQAAKEAEE